MPISNRFAGACIAMLALAPLGCSLSDSSKSISDSISSPFTSSSKSSKSDSQDYRDDVRDYTAGYVKGGGSTADGLRSGLASVARSHGVSNWEADNDTFVGVGEGLAKGGVSGAAYEGYRDAISGGDSSKAASIDKGFKSGGGN